MKRSAAIVLAVVCCAMLTTPGSAAPAPGLVLQITVDQLRGDLPGRYLERMEFESLGLRVILVARARQSARES